MKEKERHADILHSPKAKRIVSKCRKCSWAVARPQPVCRAVQRVGGEDGGPVAEWKALGGQGGSRLSSSAPPSRDELLCRSSILFSRGCAEGLGGLVGVTDGQADGSDVLYGLKVEVGKGRGLYLYKRFGS